MKQQSQFYDLLTRSGIKLLATPEVNLFLFAFLLNFVYEVWQAPYYTFYGSPTLGDKIQDLTHCTFGDGVIILICYWIISAIYHSRQWVLKPTWQMTTMFTFTGLTITLIYEAYRVNVTKSYGVPVLAVAGLGMSFLAVFQWIVLPPFVVYLTYCHLLGYEGQRF